MSSVMPKHVKWIQKAVSSFDPDSNTVTTEDGQKIAYDYLVVASGLQADVGQVKGLQEALEDPNSPVATIYDYRYAPKAFELVKNMNSGKALFAMVSGPVKCGGAPVKMLLLSEDFWRSKNIREKISVEYLPAMGSMFGVKKYSDELEKLRVDRRILGSFGHDLVAVDKGTFNGTTMVTNHALTFIFFCQTLARLLSRSSQPASSSRRATNFCTLRYLLSHRILFPRHPWQTKPQVSWR
jgi:sulfide:quinone oxidoreductase